MQNFSGFHGWRFICTADETHMRSSITLVISEVSFGLHDHSDEDFQGSYEFYLIHVSKFFALIFVFLSQDMMAYLNLALAKFQKFP
jgi:hypothetical protein